MAIAKSLPKVAVTVRSAGNTLQEHVDTETPDAHAAVTRYVEATSDQLFEVFMDIGRGAWYRGEALSFDVYVDGQCTDCPFVWRTVHSTWNHSEGVVLQGNKIQKYKFSDLEKRESVTGNREHPDKFSELGTIKVVAHFDRIVGKSGRTSDAVVGVGAVSEKDVKGQAISHSVGFTPVENDKDRGKVYTTQWLSHSRTPDAVYVFRYRSRDALKAELIIPRTPSPETEPETEPEPEPEPDPEPEPEATPEDHHTAEVKIENMSREELLELARRSKQSQNARENDIRVKREQAEGSPRRRKASRPSGHITTIELDDDGEVVSETTTQRPRGPSVDIDD